MRLVFDFAGVLFGWRPEQVMRQALPRRATDEASAAHWVNEIFQGFGGDWAAFDRGTVEPAALADTIAARTGLVASEVMAVIHAVPLALRALPDSVDLLDRLRRADQPLYFLSNMPLDYAEHLERENPFLRWFADGVFSSRVQAIKPEPAIFDLAARRFGLQPAELVFFDDLPANVEGARAAGWNALLFSDAAQAERDLRAAGWWPHGA
ncbi:MAG: HAD family phosphatase [Burkholderiales bacterium]|nr:HAD family phosphatase [Burkholderiales bacterium]